MPVSIYNLKKISEQRASDALLGRIAYLLSLMHSDKLKTDTPPPLLTWARDQEALDIDGRQVFFTPKSHDYDTPAYYILSFYKSQKKYFLFDALNTDLIFSCSSQRQIESELRCRSFGDDKAFVIQVSNEYQILNANDEALKLFNYNIGDFILTKSASSFGYRNLIVNGEQQNAAILQLLDMAGADKCTFVDFLRMKTLSGEIITTLWQVEPIPGGFWAAGFAMSAQRMPKSLRQQLKYLYNRQPVVTKINQGV